MDLVERMKKEVRDLDNQINKLEQSSGEQKRRKKSLEKALKELATGTEAQNAGQVKQGVFIS